MAEWTPTVNPVILNSGNIAPMVRYIDEIRKYGPLPPNFGIDLTEVNNTSPYIPAQYKRRETAKPFKIPLFSERGVTPPDNQRSSPCPYLHPLSPDALAIKPNPNIKKEFHHKKKRADGYFDPPFMYQANQWTWNSADTWQEALIDALNTEGSVTLDSSFIDHHYRPDENQWNPSRILHHPGDRPTFVFPGESDCAEVLRRSMFNYSLVIVCPYIKEDGEWWHRMWDKTNRPPILARWSTGVQAEYQPLVLGCLPWGATKGARGECDQVMWFSLKAKDTNPWKKTLEQVSEEKKCVLWVCK